MTVQHFENPTLNWDNREELIVAGHTHYHAVASDACLPDVALTPFQYGPVAAVEATTAAGIGAETSTAGSPAEAALVAHDTLDNLLTALDAGDDTPDMVVCGDAYDAIQHLTALNGLRAPQLVYIDPPYNTGTIFTDYSDGLDHHLWLGMMRTRLTALRDALAPTGSIWVHLDDSEMPYARVLLDEIFGRENFIAQIVVEINPKGRQLDRFFAACHDYLLVYAKDTSMVTLEPGITGSVDPQDFPYEDSQGRYRLLPLRNTNKRFNPVTARTMSYPLYANPDTGAVRSAPFTGAKKSCPSLGIYSLPYGAGLHPPSPSDPTNYSPARCVGEKVSVSTSSRSTGCTRAAARSSKQSGQQTKLALQTRQNYSCAESLGMTFNSPLQNPSLS